MIETVKRIISEIVLRPEHVSVWKSGSRIRVKASDADYRLILGKKFRTFEAVKTIFDAACEDSGNKFQLFIGDSVRHTDPIPPLPLIANEDWLNSQDESLRSFLEFLMKTVGVEARTVRITHPEEYCTRLAVSCDRVDRDLVRAIGIVMSVVARRRCRLIHVHFGP